MIAIRKIKYIAQVNNRTHVPLFLSFDASNGAHITETTFKLNLLLKLRIICNCKYISVDIYMLL